MYSIQDLEKLSGIKAHTIRIWEKRYHLLKPARTNTNIRYYDDLQLKKLLHVTTLLNQGNKISKLSQLTDQELATQVEDLMQPTHKDFQSEAFMNQLVLSALNYETSTFENTFSSALTRWGIQKTYSSVLLPLLYKIGLMWTKSELIPSQEHFISSLIKQKLYSAIDGTNTTIKKGKKFILFLPPGESHQIGLLFAYYLIKHAGHEVIYLGDNVPFKSLSHSVTKIKPDHLLFFTVRNWNKEDLKDLIENIEACFPKGKIIYATKKDVSFNLKLNKNWLIINTIDGIEKYL